MSRDREALPEPTGDDRPEQPEPSATASATRRSLGRLAATPMVRRLSARKLVVGLGLSVVLAGLLGWLVVGLGRNAVRWLQGRTQYSLAFDEIVLDPPPPPWIRSGATGLLERVRGCSEWRDTTTVGMLDLDLAALADAFRRCSPWIRDVAGIDRRYPNRVTVHLEYREPIARWTLGGAGTSRTIVLDGDGVVLPTDDLDPDGAGPLVRLLLRVPAGARLLERPGLRLAIEPAEPGDTPVEIARGACRLAVFLKRKGAVVGVGTNRSPLLVSFLQQNDDGLWIQTVEQAMIHWRVPPGQEEYGELTADRKWTLLMDWLERHRLDAYRRQVDDPTPSYLYFGRDAVLVANPPPER